VNLPLDRDRLDFIASHHHATGRRRKRPFAGTAILQGCCHDNVGTRVHFDPTTHRAEIRCHECGLFVADVAIVGKLPAAWEPIECPDCPPMTAVWPSYGYRTGILELECLECGTVVASLGVLTREGD
jgi:hypothetical protein